MNTATSGPRAMAASGLRMFLALVGMILLVTTIWLCLVAGVVLTLHPVLGPGGALLAVAAGLTVLVLVAALAVRLTRRPPPPPRPARGADAAVALALRLIGSRQGRRFGLIAVGLACLGAALAMSAPSGAPADEDAS